VRRSFRTETERGASLVEFALILPLLMMLMMGITTGGISLNRDISLNNAAREGARYGATLPIGNDMTAWLNDVATVTIESATGDLDNGVPGRTVCVAFVHPDGTDPVDRTTRVVVNATGTSTVTVGSDCFTDGRPNDERRVQVRASRESDFEVVLWSRTLTVEGESTARYERSGF
jgi:Flp pilus assembly protein TadG